VPYASRSKTHLVGRVKTNQDIEVHCLSQINCMELLKISANCYEGVAKESKIMENFFLLGNTS